LDEETRQKMGEQSCALAKAVGYSSAGTVEFIVDGDKNFYFLEMNTRLQVEHPVTELITGIDLVEQMLRVAAGEKLAINQNEVTLNGWAIESRLYAEDPYRNFLPSIGRLTRYRPPSEITRDDLVVRNDTGVYEGGEISTFYDPMIAKLCTWAPERLDAIRAMSDALDGFEVEGIGHNIPFLSAVMEQERFQEGRLTTGYIAEEFPEGFDGVELPKASRKLLAALAAHMAHKVDNRGFADASVLDLARPGNRRSVIINEERYDFSVNADSVIWHDRDDNFETLIRIDSEWQPGETLVSARVGDQRLVVQVTRKSYGFRMRYRGADLKVQVLLPHVADLMKHMPIKLPPDMSKYLLCPMPGQVVRLEVKEGDVVEDGQALAIVEAMKMENVLRAEKKARVKKLEADVGSVLAVDDVIMEFEDL
jgi:propionyl-CoA carboxylase alpha chain